MDCSSAGLRPEMLQLVLTAAKVPAMQQRILAEADTYPDITGIVNVVRTLGSSVEVWVARRTRPGGGQEVKIEVQFPFPPNTAAFETELKRAQSDGRVVMVIYQQPAGQPPMIALIWSFATAEARALI